MYVCELFYVFFYVKVFRKSGGKVVKIATKMTYVYDGHFLLCVC